MSTKTKARPVFGETKPPPEHPVRLCEWCHEQPAWWDLEVRAVLVPKGDNPNHRPRSLISGGLVCAACGDRLAREAFALGSRPAARATLV